MQLLKSLLKFNSKTKNSYNFSQFLCRFFYPKASKGTKCTFSQTMSAASYRFVVSTLRRYQKGRAVLNFLELEIHIHFSAKQKYKFPILFSIGCLSLMVNCFFVKKPICPPHQHSDSHKIIKSAIYSDFHRYLKTPFSTTISFICFIMSQ